MKNLRPSIQLSNGHAGFRAMIHAEVRVIGDKEGLVEYRASDETLDSYREIIRVRGWKHDYMRGRIPFVDSHQYHSIECELGSLVHWEVKRGELINIAKWAYDVEENTLARLGYKMIKAGHGGRVSVGFVPEVIITANDRTEYQQQLAELKLPKESKVARIYDGQQQVELSAVILGANPNAFAKAYKAEVLNDADLDLLDTLHTKMISRELAEREPAALARTGAAEAAPRQARSERFAEALRRVAARF